MVMSIIIIILITIIVISLKFTSLIHLHKIVTSLLQTPQKNLHAPTDPHMMFGKKCVSALHLMNN